MRKKILALVTTIVMIFASLGLIVGCGDNTKDDGKTEEFSAPTITLAYDSVVIGKGSNYDLLDGVTVSDKYDANIRVSVKDNGGFDKNVAGKYTVTYSAKNSKDKETTKTRSVEVAEGVLPAMGAYLKKGGAIAVPSFSESVKDAALTVSYKTAAETEWTTAEKTGDAYLLDVAAGEYQIKYEAKKDKFEYSETVTVNVYEVTAPGNSVTIVGQTVTLPVPEVSENIDGSVKVYAKTGTADYAEMTANAEDGKYYIADITEGVIDVKYVVTVAAADEEKGTEAITTEVTATVTAVNAQLENTAIDRVSEAGEVTLRTPVTSTGVNVTRTVTKIDYENSEATVTDGKITVALGELYQVTYAYTYDGLDLGADGYMVYYPVTGANVLDFDNWTAPNYSTAQHEIAASHGLNGTNSLHVRWYGGASIGNWHGYKSCNLDMGQNVSKVTFYANAFHDFTNHVGLWVSCKDESGKTVSNAYSKPVGEGTVDYVKFTQGWHKYTLDLKCTFRTLDTFTFYVNERDPADVSEDGVYIDGMYFHA